MGEVIYKIARPMTYDELKNKIPEYDVIPIWADNECRLVYFNIWGKIYYMSPDGQGELRNVRKIVFYDRKLQPEFVVAKREYIKWYSFPNEIRTNFHCPNCDSNLVPYDYDYSRLFASGQVRHNFCKECGYPLLWY